MYVALLHLVCLKALEAEARQIAGARGDAAQGHARHALHRIGCDEGATLVHVLGQAHVADRGVISVREDLQEVMVLGEVFGGVVRHLHGPSAICDSRKEVPSACVAGWLPRSIDL